MNLLNKLNKEKCCFTGKVKLMVFSSKILMYVLYLYNIQDNMKFQKEISNMLTCIAGIPEVFP